MVEFQKDVVDETAKSAANAAIESELASEAADLPSSAEQEVEATSMGRAQRAGAKLVTAEKESDQLGKDFAVHAAIVILSDHRALLDMCEAEGLKRRSRSKIKYLMELDFLSGLSNLKAGSELSDAAFQALKDKIPYCARQAEALVWHARNEKLDITGIEEDFKTLSDSRDKAGGVKKLMAAYGKVKKPKKKRRVPHSNQKSTVKDVMAAVKSGYASRPPKTSIKLSGAPGENGDLGILLASKASSDTLDVHEILRLPTSGLKALLKQAANLPVGDDPALNSFADLLFVGTKAFPKDAVEITKEDDSGKTITVKRDDCRQILLRPKADEAWISRRFSQAPISMRVKRIKAMPGLPAEDAYVFTKHRINIDPFTNRFDRQMLSIEAAQHEYDAKWNAKLVLSENGGGTTYPVHLHEAATHSVDIRIPDLTGVNWNWSFKLGKDTLVELWNTHIETFASKLKSSEDTFVQVSGRNKKVGVKFSDYGHTELHAEDCNIGNDKKDTWIDGDNFVRIVDAVNHLDLSGPVTFSVDTAGLICVSAPTSIADYEFYAPTADGPNAKLRDAHYRSAHRLFYAEATANEDAA